MQYDCLGPDLASVIRNREVSLIRGEGAMNHVANPSYILTGVFDCKYLSIMCICTPQDCGELRTRIDGTIKAIGWIQVLFYLQSSKMSCVQFHPA